MGLAGGTFGFFSVRPNFGYGVWAGSAIVLVNLAILARSVQKLLTGGGGRWGVVVVLKFVGLIAVTYFLLGLVAVDPLGLALGFATLPLGIVLGSAFGSSRAGKTKANSAPAVDSAHDSSMSSSATGSSSASHPSS